MNISDTHLKILFDNIHDVIFVLGVEPSDQFRFLAVNSRFTSTTGLFAGQVIGMPVQNVIPKKSLANVLEKYKQAIKERKTVYWEEISNFPAGEKIGEVCVTPVFSPNGDCIQLIGVVRDITDHKHLEQSLIAREQQSRLLIENSPDTIARYDLECRRIYVNPAFGAMAEGGASALLGKSPSEYPGGENSAIYESLIKKVIDSGCDEQFELKWPNKDGKVICSHIRLTAERNLSGVVTSVLGVGRDISELDNYRTELIRVSERLKESQAVAGIGSYVVDVASGLWTSSEVLDQIFGIDETYDRSVEGWESLIHPDDRAMMSEYFKNEVLGKRGAFDKEYRIIRKVDNGIRWVHGLGKLEIDTSGEVLTMLGTIQDVTKQKNNEAALLLSEERYRRIIEQAPIGMAITSKDGRIKLVNQAFCTMLGYAKKELEDIYFREITHPEDTTLTDPHRQKLLDEEINLFQQEKRYIRKDGQIVWGLVSSSLERNMLDGDPYFIAQVENITARKLAEANVLALNDHLQTTLDAIPDLLFEIGLHGKIYSYHSPKTELLAAPPEIFIGNNFADFVPPDVADVCYSAIMEAKAKGNSTGKQYALDIDGNKHWFEISMAKKQVRIDEEDRFILLSREITERKKHETELAHIANYDTLTGIPNRTLLADRLRQGIAQVTRDQNMMAVCYLDLDGFKPINDTFGHEVGDKVLVEVSKRIGNSIRAGDTVARLGGDEFVVLLLGQEKGEESISTIERILSAISQPISVINEAVIVSASIGVSIYPIDDEDPDTLLRHADQAMYVAKQSGRNCFHIYDSAQDKRVHDHNEFLKHIRQGLEKNQFELHYQPKVNMASKELVGAEALIRWRHPDRGLLFPSDFLRHIENTDLDILLGEWVTETALSQIRLWRNEGMEIEVSINISGFHLESAGFVDRLKEQLAQVPDLPRGSLQIEVLETVALNDIVIVREIIESCRSYGIGFALDDFGTGFSSLSYLSRLPIDTLKIDQSFVRDMLDDKGDRAIVEGVIALARTFGRHIVAEGVETEKHFQALLDMGCEIGQGYAIAKPMPASELINWRNEYASLNKLI